MRVIYRFGKCRATQTSVAPSDHSRTLLRRSFKSTASPLDTPNASMSNGNDNNDDFLSVSPHTTTRMQGYVYRQSRFHVPPAVASRAAAARETVARHKVDVKQLPPRGELLDASLLRKESFVPSDLDKVPPVAHGLERVVRERGVHLMRHPLTRAANFDPWLSHIHQPEEIHLDRLTPFVTTSQDHRLHAEAARLGAKFAGSTSSLSGALSQVYFALSFHKPIVTDMLTSTYTTMTRKLTPTMLKPATFFLRQRGDVYAIDADPGNVAAKNNILLELGKTMERMLTMSPTDFTHLLVKAQDEHNVDAAGGVTEGPAVAMETGGLPDEVYHYQLLGDMLLRAQLDCRSTALPGYGTFDLKTRATVAVRCDMANYKQQTAYRIGKLTGIENSFEREFYDMARSVFLKYYFQVRIGEMAGIMCAYHNTKEIFGFEYISKEELEECVFGCSNYAETIFSNANTIFQIILRRIRTDIGGEAVRVVLAADPAQGSIDVFAEQVKDDKGWSESRGDDTDDASGGRADRDDERSNAMEDIESWYNSTRKPTASQFTRYVSGTVHHYRVHLDIFKNGKRELASYDFTDDDKLAVYFEMEKVCTKQADEVYGDYLDALRRTDLLAPHEEV